MADGQKHDPPHGHGHQGNKECNRCIGHGRQTNAYGPSSGRCRSAHHGASPNSSCAGRSIEISPPTAKSPFCWTIAVFVPFPAVMRMCPHASRVNSEFSESGTVLSPGHQCQPLHWLPGRGATASHCTSIELQSFAWLPPVAVRHSSGIRLAFVRHSSWWFTFHPTLDARFDLPYLPSESSPGINFRKYTIFTLI